MDDELAQRTCVVAEARTWLGTPYHHMARVKGAGVDCGQILAAVYEAAGVIGHIDTGAYPHDWHMHRSDEMYLSRIEEIARRIDGPPKPGDICLFRFGRCISHGAIVIAWPCILHSYVGRGVILDDVVPGSALSARLVGYWSPWGR
jgi:cell wall-associated NlpC family hydrolase